MTALRKINLIHRAFYFEEHFISLYYYLILFAFIQLQSWHPSAGTIGAYVIWAIALIIKDMQMEIQHRTKAGQDHLRRRRVSLAGGGVSSHRWLLVLHVILIGVNAGQYNSANLPSHAFGTRGF